MKRKLLLAGFALPLPSSLMMMAGGAFAAAGDLVLWQLCAGAFLGGLTWVAVYVTLGYAFGSQIEALADMRGSVLGALALAVAAGVVTALLGRALWRRRRDER